MAEIEIDQELVKIQPFSGTESDPNALGTDLLLLEREGRMVRSPLGNIYDKVNSGIKGNATQTNAPTTYSAETHPDGLIETYRAVEPLNNTSEWYNLADATNKAKFPITQEILNANDVLLTSTNGVVSVFLNVKLKGDSAYEVAVINGFIGTEAEWVISLKPTKTAKIKDVRTDMALSNGATKIKNGFIVPVGSTGQDSLLTTAIQYYGIGHVFKNKDVGVNFKYKVENIGVSNISLFSNRDGAGYISQDTTSETIDGSLIITVKCKFSITDLNYIQMVAMIHNTTGRDIAKEYSVELMEIEIDAETLSENDYRFFKNQIENGYLENTLSVNKEFTSDTPDFGWKKFNSIIAAHEYIKNSGELNRFIIEVADGIYDEFNVAFGSSVTAPTYVGMLVKNHVSFIGNLQYPENCKLVFDGAYGMAAGTATDAELFKKCIFHITHNQTVYGILNTTFYCRISGFHIDSKNSRYCIHPETAGLGQHSKTELSDLILQYGSKPALTHLGASYVNSGCHIGMGVTLGEIMEIKRVKCIKSAYTDEYSYAINGHNNGHSEVGTKPIPLFKRGSSIFIEDVFFDGLALGYQALANGETFDFVELKNLKGVHHTWFSYFAPAINSIKVSAEAVDAEIQFAP